MFITIGLFLFIEIEEYLEYMSSNGRQLAEISRGIHQKFIFKITEPKDLSYRLVLSNKKELDQKQMDIIEKNGWEYICPENPLARKQSFHVFASDKKDADNTIIDRINKKAAANFRFRSVLSSGIPLVILILILMHILLLWTTNPGLHAWLKGSTIIMIATEVMRYIYLLKPEWEFYIRHKKKSKYQDKQEWKELSEFYKRDMWLLSFPIIFLPAALLRRALVWY